MTTHDFLPVLSRGAHTDPRGRQHRITPPQNSNLTGDLTLTDEHDAARAFTRAGHATNADHARSVLSGFLGDPPHREYTARLAELVYTGGLVTSYQARDHFSRDGFAPISLGTDGGEPHEVAAAQVVSCHLNDDPDAAADVILAHHAVAGAVGLGRVLAALLGLCREVHRLSEAAR